MRIMPDQKDDSVVFAQDDQKRYQVVAAWKRMISDRVWVAGSRLPIASIESIDRQIWQC